MYILRTIKGQDLVDFLQYLNDTRPDGWGFIHSVDYNKHGELLLLIDDELVPAWEGCPRSPEEVEGFTTDRVFVTKDLIG